jgi:putative ABC transport system permease protein
LIRDLWISRGRVTLMVVAIAVALTGVGGLLIARAVVLREADAAYAATIPASATLDVDGGIDAALLAEVRARPGVADATTRQTITTRVRVDGEWRRMMLFVIDPADPLTIARFRVDSGAWPPADDALMIERVAGTVLDAATGDSLDIAGPSGATAALRITGTVYDPALAPATQERTGYGYLTPTALARLGFRPVAEQLKIVVGHSPGGAAIRDQSTVDGVASDLAAWLTANGHPAHRVDAPPFRHPHQNQVNTITGLFLAFAAAALILAGVLVATTLGGMLASQTRQIGVMKTVGATTGQVLRMYLGVTVVIAAVATLLAIGPALLAGSGLVDLVAAQLNIDVGSRALPWWVFTAVVVSGVGIPVLVALAPLIRATRITVRTALDDHGGDARAGARRIDRSVARLGGGRIGALAARNMIRRRTRLALTLALLAAGGALFTAGLNTSAAWRAWVDQGLAKRQYDAQLELANPMGASAVAATVRGVVGVTAVETLVSRPVTPAVDGRVQVQRTYPDGGHGQFLLTALPADTTMVHFDLIKGRWLRPDDTSAVVLNQAAATRLGDPQVGSDVRLAVEGKITTWRVVGIVAEVGGPATGYTIPNATSGTAGDAVNVVRIRVTGDVQAATDRVEAALAAIGTPVATTLATSELRRAIDVHVEIFIVTLIALAVLMAIVGVLGLASTMSIAVTERTREYGIMQAVGATPAIIRRLVMTESVLTGALGCALAIGLGIPLSTVVGDFLGRLSFGLPLPIQLSALGLAVWIVLAVVGAAAASLTAAQRAARLTVRETLIYQ